MISCTDVTLMTGALHFRTRQSHACDDHAPPDISPSRMPEKRVTKIEYKTVLLPYKTGLFQADVEDPLALTLNKAGEEGWSLSQIVLPSTVWGRANTMIAIMQRPKV